MRRWQRSIETTTLLKSDAPTLKPVLNARPLRRELLSWRRDGLVLWKPGRAFLFADKKVFF